jgi:hypothetical protein
MAKMQIYQTGGIGPCIWSETLLTAGLKQDTPITASHWGHSEKKFFLHSNFAY